MEYEEKVYQKYARRKQVDASVKALGLVFIIVLVYLLLTAWAYSGRQTVRCSDFKTQPSAQTKYLSDPVKYGNLDANHDGVACNNLPK